MTKRAAAKKVQEVASSDPVTRALEAATETFRTMTPKEALEMAERAGIYTKDGKLTAPYRGDSGKKTKG